MYLIHKTVVLVSVILRLPSRGLFIMASMYKYAEADLNEHVRVRTLGHSFMKHFSNFMRLRNDAGVRLNFDPIEFRPVGS